MVPEKGLEKSNSVCPRGSFMWISSLSDAAGNRLSVDFVLLITACECSQISTHFVVHIFSPYFTNLDIETLQASVKDLAKVKVNNIQSHLHWLSPLSTEDNHFMIEAATWIWQQHNYLFGLSRHSTRCWIRALAKQTFSCDISSKTSFVFSHIVFHSYQSPPLQNTVLLHYTLNMLHKEYQDPLPQVFQVISFQLSSVICWEYYLENSLSSISYDIHQLLFVLWNSVKHFYDFIFIHSSWSLQIFIFISLFLLLLWLINIGMWYDL